MLALCSMLSRTYYAHFNAGIISAPLEVGGAGVVYVCVCVCVCEDGWDMGAGMGSTSCVSLRPLPLS